VSQATSQAKKPNRPFVRFLWTAVIFLALIGQAVATRRTIVLLKPGALSSSRNPAADLDAHFAGERALVLTHILPAMLFMVLGPLQFALSASSPLVGTSFSRRQRRRGNHWIEIGLWKNHRGHR
jgi:hypothetical protein